MSAILDSLARQDAQRSADLDATDRAMSNIHPIFRGLVDSIATLPMDLEQIKRSAYVKSLKTHDWEFEMSDDHSVYERGREALAQLRLVQREIDPDWTIWNEHAPEFHRMGSMAKVDAARRAGL